MTRPVIKICGFTTVYDALQAVDAGADYLGVIFVPNTPRCVGVEKALAIREAVEGRAKLVGVFQNSPLAYIQAVVANVGLDFVQFHGEASVQDVLTCPVPAIQVVTVRPGTQVDWATMAQKRPNLHAVLLDLPKNATEAQWDFSAFPRPKDRLVPTWLAGKLTPQTVGQAITTCQPDGVDVASGVEATPGHKDPEKILAFCRAVRHH